MKELPQIEARIKTIANDIANGVSRGDIVGKYGKLWGSSRTSIDRYIGKAKILAETIRTKADKIIEEKTVEVLKDAAINGLRSAIDVDLAVQAIIFNPHKLVRLPDSIGENGKIVKGRVVKVDNTTSDVLKAAMIYYRRHNLLGKTDMTKQKMKIIITGKKPPKSPDENGTAGT